MARLQRIKHGGRVEQSTPTRINQVGTGFHPGQRVGIDQVVGFRKERAMQRYDIGLRQKFIQRQIIHAKLLQDSRTYFVIRQHMASKTEHDAGKGRANFTRANNANPFTM